ncbi:hypothetical protein CYMTET_34235 [Cymbomonas tetramitiformis]|uniref:Uncharacterized protein n=1 Tax=Cymbomonas tetramitiformis TaxID=36881 RepID=A0AAE0FBM5_9CHLO|nr:hypothetical protein CYMTET_34235 [Cymbomonas tetramitiformis]
MGIPNNILPVSLFPLRSRTHGARKNSSRRRVQSDSALPESRTSEYSLSTTDAGTSHLSARQHTCIYCYISFQIFCMTRLMREIVDKYYVDNWVIPFSLGHTVDLSVEWKPYQAAKLALDNVITPSLAKKLQFEHVARLPGLLTDLASFLTEGVLTEEFILCNHDWDLYNFKMQHIKIP